MADRKASFQAWSRKKRIAVKLLPIGSGILTGLLITEIVLRVVGYSYPEFYRADAARGYALRPGVEGWYRKEGKSYVEQHQVFLHGFGEKLGGGHWNQLGHKVAGEALAKEMCDALRN